MLKFFINPPGRRHFENCEAHVDAALAAAMLSSNFETESSWGQSDLLLSVRGQRVEFDST